MSDLRNQVDSVYHVVRALFDYVKDLVQFNRRDDWRSHFAAVERGYRFKDDCDGFAWTMLDALEAAGVPGEVRGVIKERVGDSASGFIV